MHNQVQDILLHHDTKLEKPWEHRLAYGALCHPAPYKRARGDARYSAHAIEEHVCHLAAAAGNKELDDLVQRSRDQHGGDNGKHAGAVQMRMAIKRGGHGNAQRRVLVKRAILRMMKLLTQLAGRPRSTRKPWTIARARHGWISELSDPGTMELHHMARTMTMDAASQGIDMGGPQPPAWEPTPPPPASAGHGGGANSG